MSKNILITGSNGQLGRELQELIHDKAYCLPLAKFYFADRDSLDITVKEALHEFIVSHSIDTIVNCAAYTLVDKAEEDQEQADKINREAVKHLAELSQEKGIWLIHISTDYVFDGTGHKPYEEDDPVAPQGVYGRSKLAGEKEINLIAPKNAIIIRTSWLYSSFGSNFLKTMLKLGKSKREISVVCEQIGTPTYARDLAEAILRILEQKSELIKSNPSESVSLFHFSNEGICSWYDFAHAIFELSNIKCKINPISTEQYPTPAKRPYYSVLDKTKIKEAYNLEIPHWRDSLKSCISCQPKEQGNFLEQ